MNLTLNLKIFRLSLAYEDAANAKLLKMAFATLTINNVKKSYG
jgi:hypothetical protein